MQDLVLLDYVCSRLNVNERERWNEERIVEAVTNFSISIYPQAPPTAEIGMCPAGLA